MLKLLDQVVNFLIFSHRISIVNDFERFSWLFLDGTIKGTTVNASAHFFALVGHGFKDL